MVYWETWAPDPVAARKPVPGGDPLQYSFISPGGFSFSCHKSYGWIVLCQDLGHSRLGTSHLKSDVFPGYRTVPQGFGDNNLTSRNGFHSTHLETNDLETRFSSFYASFADF